MFLFLKKFLNKNLLVKGINNINPKISVRKPGIIKSKEASAIDAPERIS